MSILDQQPEVRPIAPQNIVENGALIVVCGKHKSGKTCVVENVLFYCLDSFVNSKFAPLYIAENPDYGKRYFGNLFSNYLCADIDALRQMEIWQLGHQEEFAETQFRRQGAVYQELQNDVKPQGLIKLRPRLLFYFDKCNTALKLNYVEQCLEKTSDHRLQNVINVVETELTLSFGRLRRPDIIIFTSRFDAPNQRQYFCNLLECSNSFAADLIQTANTFIDSCHVALVINVHLWFESNHKRGIFIYDYPLVPPLDEQLSLRMAANSYVQEESKEKKRRRRHRHRHARRKKI